MVIFKDFKSIFIFFLFLEFSTQFILFAGETPKEIMELKNNIGSTNTKINTIFNRFGNNFIYSEIDAYGQIPNTEETDKILVYNFSGLKIMYFYSEVRNKSFLYFWEITDNKFLEGTSLYLGISYNEVISIYGEPNNKISGYIDFSFADGSYIFLEFDEDKSLISIYWTQDG